MNASKIYMLSLILVAACFSKNYAQEQIPASTFTEPKSAKPVKRVAVRDVYVHVGLFAEKTSDGSLADFKAMAPKSVLLNSNMAGYTEQSGAFSLSADAFFSMMLGLTFSDKEKKAYRSNPLLRVGLTYFTSNNFNGYLYKSSRKTYDTLVSAQTGQRTPLDSVISQSYGMNYTSQQLRLDLSVLFRTNPEARWSIYTGIGVSAGVSFNARTNIYYSRSVYTDPGANSFPYGPSGSGAYLTESYRQKNNVGICAYVPLGVDLRLGRKKEFWKRAHLFYEVRPGINMTSIPELRAITNISLQQGFGFKVTTS